MRAKIPFSHGDLENGKDNHEVSGIFLSVKVGDESSEEIMVVVVKRLECCLFLVNHVSGVN